jgi:hypothetical protein
MPNISPQGTSFMEMAQTRGIVFMYQNTQTNDNPELLY